DRVRAAVRTQRVAHLDAARQPRAHHGSTLGRGQCAPLQGVRRDVVLAGIRRQVDTPGVQHTLALLLFGGDVGEDVMQRHRGDRARGGPQIADLVRAR
ncbi:unnamed protein product, partial [Mycena citricolor]